MASPTPNKQFTYPAHGGAVNAWDTPLNADFDGIDLCLGGTTSLTLGSSVATVNLTAPQTYAARFALSGVLANNTTITLLSSVSGGNYVVDNQTTGAFAVSFVTSISTTTGAVTPQGGQTLITCDGANVTKGDVTSQAKLNTFLGDPTGSVAGTQGNANGASTDVVWDAVNRVLRVPTVTGTPATTVWTPVCGYLIPQGILTINNNSVNPVPTGDVISATSVLYFPFRGNWTLLHDGTSLIPYQFAAGGTVTLSLTNSQTNNSVYDIFYFYNSGSPVIGTGPSWAAGGGSTTIRGTGAGSTAIGRLAGVWVNSVSMTLINGVNSYTCPANNGVYLGSILIDNSPGQVTCHRSYGQARKWGVFNAYNRLPVTLICGDPTASWAYSSSVFRPANGNSNNFVAAFAGLAEEMFSADSIQTATSPGGAKIGIGWNTSTAASGTATSALSANAITMSARYVNAPALGVYPVYAVESNSGGTTTFFGTNTNMQLSLSWRA